jgi:hypothetical protein
VKDAAANSSFQEALAEQECISAVDPMTLLSCISDFS